MTVVATPTSPFRFEFEVERDGEPVGRFRHRAGRPGGEAWLGETAGAILRTGRAEWRLEAPGVAPVTLGLVPRLRRMWQVSWPGGEVEVSPSPFGFRSSLLRDGEPVGSVRLRTLFTRTLVAEVPDDLPDGALLLILWAVVRQRRAL